MIMRKIIFIIVSLLSMVLFSCDDNYSSEDKTDLGKTTDRLDGTKWVSSDVSGRYGFISHTTTKAYAEFSDGYVYVTINGRKQGSGKTTTEEVARCKYHIEGETVVFENFEQNDAVFDMVGLSALVRRGDDVFLRNLKKQ